MKLPVRSINADIKLGISSCLAGQKVRYDGGDRYQADIMQDLSRCFALVTVCPEVGIGLPVPRPPIQLQQYGKFADVYLRGIESGEDFTDRMKTFAGQIREELADICGYLFKSRSPSCAVHDAEVINPDSDLVHAGPGMYARELMTAMPMMPAADENRLQDRLQRHRFIEQVYLYSRWMVCVGNGVRKDAIRHFHAVHRFNALVYDEYAVLQLDDLVQDDSIDDVVELAREYILLFMNALESAHEPDYVRVIDSLLDFEDELCAAASAEERRALHSLAGSDSALADLAGGLVSLFNRYRIAVPDCYFLRPYQADYEVRYLSA